MPWRALKLSVYPKKPPAKRRGAAGTLHGELNEEKNGDELYEHLIKLSVTGILLGSVGFFKSAQHSCLIL